MVLNKIKQTAELVKFSHTIFALPFALASMVVAAGGWPGSRLFLLILAAMVTARTSAMAFNRWADARIDAQNPRTTNRQIPQGIFSRRFVLTLALTSGLLFIFTTYFINTLAFALAPLALLILWGYSFTKRFTFLSQMVLGLSLGMAPIGAWIAVRGQIEGPPIILGLAVLFWVAGFDIIYATQDESFDRKMGLHSLVVKLGIARALNTARCFHLLTVLILILFGYATHLSGSYYLFVTLVGLSFLYEHRLVSPDDLSKVNAAFFNVNGFVSLLFLIGTTVAIVVN